MLTITKDAADAISALLAQHDMPEGAGARIATDDAEGNLQMAVVATPANDDAVVERDGAKVFLEAQAAQVLDDKTLDVQQVAETDGDARLQFAIVAG